MGTPVINVEHDRTHHIVLLGAECIVANRLSDELGEDVADWFADCLGTIAFSKLNATVVRQIFSDKTCE